MGIVNKNLCDIGDQKRLRMRVIRSADNEMPIGYIYRKEQDAICLPTGHAGLCHESGVRATYYRFIMKNVDHHLFFIRVCPVLFLEVLI